MSASSSSALPIAHLALRILIVVNWLSGAAIFALLVAMPTEQWIMSALESQLMAHAGGQRVAIIDRRTAHEPQGHIVLLLSILGAGIPVVHMMGTGLVGGRLANSSGVFFWVWTLIALGVTASFANDRGRATA